VTVAVGIALGVLVGVVSGAAFLVFLRAAFGGEPQKAGAGLVSMPATWFGGGWLTTVFDISQILSAYVTALAATVVLIGALPLYQLVIRIGHDIGKPA
jgi:hypothetical protein